MIVGPSRTSISSTVTSEDIRSPLSLTPEVEATVVI
jgi:hypothetical protein